MPDSKSITLEPMEIVASVHRQEPRVTITVEKIELVKSNELVERNTYNDFVAAEFLGMYLDGERFGWKNNEIVFIEKEKSDDIIFDFSECRKITNYKNGKTIGARVSYMNWSQRLFEDLESYGIYYKNFTKLIDAYLLTTTAQLYDLNSCCYDVWHALYGHEQRHGIFTSFLLEKSLHELFESFIGDQRKSVGLIGFCKPRQRLPFLVKYNNKSCYPHFFRHEEYLGSVSDLLEKSPDLSIFGSSFFEFVPTTSTGDVLTLIPSKIKLERFSLLAGPYKPDTFELWNSQKDTQDWCIILMKTLSQVISDIEKPNELCQKVENYIERVKENPIAYGPFSVRRMFEIREQFLVSLGYRDIFGQKKNKETILAMNSFAALIAKLDLIEPQKKLEVILKCVLSGNVFDWGASKVAEKMKNDFRITDFYNTLDAVNFDENVYETIAIINRNIRKYRSVVVFPDNAGIDFIFGIMPMVRELLKMGKKVLLVANSRPCINDLVFNEMVQQVSTLNDDVIQAALHKRQLQCVESGQGSPCVDLSGINAEVNKKMAEMKTDLVVLEGMGRALHSNLHAKFKCDSVKIATIKSEWLAKRLKRDMYSQVIKYEQGSLNQTE